jgi:hypothetical protein
VVRVYRGNIDSGGGGRKGVLVGGDDSDVALNIDVTNLKRGDKVRVYF